MAKQKLSELVLANSVSHLDLTYLVQSGISKSTNIKTIVDSISTSNISEGSNLYFTNARTRAAFTGGSGIIVNANGMIVANLNSSLFNVTTDNLVEGTINFYWTADRQYSAYITGTGIFASANGLITTNAILTINNTEPNGLGQLSLYTDNIIVGTNLYYTNARVYANVAPLIANLQSNIAALTTSNVTEGTNLYYTNARVYANVAPLIANLQSNIAAVATIANNATNSNITLSLSNHTTSNLAEGSNLYFSNARAILASIPAVTQLVVTTPVFNYNIDSYIGDNPTIYVQAGSTLSFDLQMNAHPFAIRESNGGANVSTGLTHVATNGTISTGAAAQGKISGKLFWKIPFAYVGNTVVYQCTTHPSMVGNISILNPTTGGNVGAGNGVGGIIYLPGDGIGIDASNVITTTANLENFVFEVSSAYISYDHNYIINGNTNPNLTLYKGRTYKFNVNATGHPFYIQTTAAPYNANSLYTKNVKNNGTQSGNIFITVSDDTPNLYYVCQVHPSMSGLLHVKDPVAVDSVNGLTGTIFLTTSNISEGSNLYFTNARTIAAFTGGSGITVNANGVISSNLSLSTSNVIEGSNLYFTNARAILASIPAVTQLVVTTPVFNYNIDSYIGDNPTIYVQAGSTLSFDLQMNSHPFAIRESNGGANINTGLTHVATNETISTGAAAQGKISGKLFWKIPFAYVGNTVVYQCTTHPSMVGNIIIQKALSTVTTSDIPEGSNLYFTNARTIAAFTGGSGINIEGNGVISSNATVLISSNADVSFGNVSAGSFYSTGTGVPTLNSNTNINLSANNAVVITNSVLRLRSFTSTQRGTLSPSNGDLIYNSTTNKVQAYAGGTWVDLH